MNTLSALLVLGATAAPSVGLIDEPKLAPDHVRVEIVAQGPAGVRVTNDLGHYVWLRWLDRGQDAALEVMPVAAGRPGKMTWHGEKPNGDRLTFRIVRIEPCPCTLEITSGERTAFTWSVPEWSALESP